MIDAVIIEDKLKMRSLLKTLLKEYCPDIYLRGEADSVETGLKLIKSIKPSLVFLDVELGDGNAFDLLTQLTENNFHLIFTTAYDHYALRAIKFSAIDYLLKPISGIDLKAAVEKVKSRSADTLINNVKMLMTNFTSAGKKQPDRIALPTFEGQIFINLANIIRFEAEGNYTCIFTIEGEKILVSKTLKDFENFINPDEFIRIHHAHIVNIKHIKRYIKGAGGFVIMADNTKVEVSRRKKEEFLQKIRIN